MLNNQPQIHLKQLPKKQFKTDDLIGNKIANKIAKKSPQNSLETVESETEIPKERHISPENYWWIKSNIII